MRIGIDCRFANHLGGLGTYTREISKRITRDTTVHWTVYVHNLELELLQDLPDSVEVHAVDFPHYSLAEQLQFPKLLRSVDAVFCPHFNVPIRCPVPFVCTIHDLILHHYPNQSGALKRMAYKYLMKNAVQKSKHIIAVSNYTKNDLLEVYGTSISGKTSVVTEGVDPIFTQQYQSDPSLLQSYGMSDNFFLYVGNAKEHKNVQMLCDAHVASSTSTPLVLICGGIEANALQLTENQKLIRSVPHEHLPIFYKHAKCFVTASLYEGFCLPIVEAHASGCPVIASNRTAIPEVCGPNTLLVEPSIESISAAIQAPPAQADSLNEKHNWDAAAEDTSAILRTALYG